MGVKRGYTFGIVVVTLGICLALAGCSTKKNTLMRRAYHRFTSYFNYYFNAEQAYEQGERLAEKNMRYDYTRILPFSIAGLPDAAMEAGGDMDRAIEKSGALIRFHSITVKPERGAKALTPKQKAFYSQNEFNVYARKAWLLLGKARVWSGDLPKAKEALEFGMRQFSKQEQGWESCLWMGRVEMLSGSPLDAKERFATLRKSRHCPKGKRATFHLEGMWADLLVGLEDYEGALPHAEKAVAVSRRGVERNRCELALAQLYETVGQSEKAFTLYKRVARRADKYEMMFNARVRMASLAARVQGKGMDAALRKMAKDEKNLEYLDQIYFALGQIAMAEGDTVKAIDLYKESAAKSVANAKQKGVAYLAVGQYYYRRKEYLPAQQFYDSALTALPDDYPHRERIVQVGAVLNSLAEASTTIAREDSLQRVARLPKEERDRIVNQCIERVQQREREEQEEQERQRRNMNFARQNQYRNQSLAGTSTGGSNWYFYNSQTLASGATDFRLYWGNRKLEDNWRRKNKAVQENFEGMTTVAEGEKEGQAQLTNKMPEYYLRDLPLTDSAVRESDARIAQAYFQLGRVYKDELKDYGEAVESYGELSKRFADFPNAPEACYRAYEAATEAGLTSRAERYRSILLSKYPQSPFALRISDPMYLTTLYARKAANEKLYQEGVTALRNGDRTAAFAVAQQGIEKNATGDYLRRFEFLSALSAGAAPASIQHVEALRAFAKKFGDTEEGAYVRRVLSAITRRELTGASVAEQKMAAEVEDEAGADANVSFSPWEDESLVGIVVPDTVEMNQLKFNLIAFSVDYNVDLNLEVIDEAWGKGRSVIYVKTFGKRSEAEAYTKALEQKGLLEAYKVPILVLSLGNLRKLKELGIVNPYVKFYRREYGR